MGMFDWLTGKKEEADNKPARPGPRPKVDEISIRLKRMAKFAAIGAVGLCSGGALLGAASAAGWISSGIVPAIVGIGGAYTFSTPLLALMPYVFGGAALLGAIGGAVIGALTADGEIKAEQTASDRNHNALTRSYNTQMREQAEAELKTARAGDAASRNALAGLESGMGEMAPGYTPVGHKTPTDRRLS